MTPLLAAWPLKMIVKILYVGKTLFVANQFTGLTKKMDGDGFPPGGGDNPFVFILLMVIAPHPTPPSDHTLHLPLRRVACLIHPNHIPLLYYNSRSGGVGGG